MNVVEFDKRGDFVCLPKEVIEKDIVFRISYYGVRALGCVNRYYNGVVLGYGKELGERFVKSGVEEEAGEYRRYLEELRELEEVWSCGMYWKVVIVNSYCYHREECVSGWIVTGCEATSKVIEIFEKGRELAGRDRRDLEKVLRVVGVEGFRAKRVKEGALFGGYLRRENEGLYQRVIEGGVLLRKAIGIDRVERRFWSLCVSLGFGYGVCMFSYVVCSALSWLVVEFLLMRLEQVVGLDRVKEGYGVHFLREMVILKGVYHCFIRMREGLEEDLKVEGVGNANVSTLGGYIALLTIMGWIVGIRVLG